MNKPLTVMIIDGATWYSEDDWKALVAQKVGLEARSMKRQKPIDLTEQDIERVLDEAFKTVFGRYIYGRNTKGNDDLS